MTALLDEPRSPAINAQTSAQNLRAGMAAVRVSFTWLGTRRSLSAEQRDEAAQPFDADGGSLSAGKKILDTKHSAYKVLTAVKTKIASTWKGMSLSFPTGHSYCTSSQGGSGFPGARDRPPVGTPSVRSQIAGTNGDGSVGVARPRSRA
jgi:hypothetical protein